MLISDVVNKIKDSETGTRKFLVPMTLQQKSPLLAPRQCLVISVGLSCCEKTSYLLCLPFLTETIPLPREEHEVEVSERACRKHLFWHQLNSWCHAPTSSHVTQRCKANGLCEDVETSPYVHVLVCGDDRTIQVSCVRGVICRSTFHLLWPKVSHWLEIVNIGHIGWKASHGDPLASSVPVLRLYVLRWNCVCVCWGGGLGIELGSLNLQVSVLPSKPWPFHTTHSPQIILKGALSFLLVCLEKCILNYEHWKEI